MTITYLAMNAINTFSVKIRIKRFMAFLVLSLNSKKLQMY